MIADFHASHQNNAILPNFKNRARAAMHAGGHYLADTFESQLI
jgi:hypothetical protein